MSLFDYFRAARRAPEALKLNPGPGVLCAPCSGRVVAMPDLPDPVFAEGMMGKAMGVWPDEGVVYAPISGTVTVAMPHALGISGGGVELLVHVGVDTVNMNGDGFEVKVRKGDRVRAGDVLLVFDREKVAAAGYPDAVMEVVTNSSEIEESGGTVDAIAGESVRAGDPLMRVSA